MFDQKTVDKIIEVSPKLETSTFIQDFKMNDGEELKEGERNYSLHSQDQSLGKKSLADSIIESFKNIKDELQHEISKGVVIDIEEASHVTMPQKIASASSEI